MGMGCCLKPRVDMVCREFEITLISARNLKPGKHFRMRVYARVSIGGDTEKQSPVDTDNETNPAWHFKTIHTIDDSAVQHDCTMLIIKLYCKRWIGDRYIGEVHVSLKELYKRARRGSYSNTVEYSVKKGSVISQGRLQFSYRFGGTMVDDDDQKPCSFKRSLRDAAISVLKVSVKVMFGLVIPI